MLLPNAIEIRPDVMMGKPCIQGTRIPVYLILQKIADGETPEQILGEYPQLHRQHVDACLKYAALIASEEVLLPRQ